MGPKEKVSQLKGQEAEDEKILLHANSVFFNQLPNFDMRFAAFCKSTLYGTWYIDHVVSSALRFTGGKNHAPFRRCWKTRSYKIK